MHDLSVIVSTYDQPRWLEKVLYGYLAQEVRDFELLVADDGSDRETSRVVDEVRKRAPFPIRHVWHDVEGYERSTILNQAVIRARGAYLVFSDGDCVPRSDFVATHRRLRRSGHFLSGGMVKLTEGASQEITRDEILAGRCFQARWLATRRAFRPRRHALRLLPAGPWSAVLDAVTPTKATFNLNNSSVWKEIVLQANGFEREMKYGGADRAFGERLKNAGIRGVQVRFRAVLLHLAHGRPYATDESKRKNLEIRRRIRREGETRAREGIRELDPSEAGPPPWSRMDEDEANA